MRMMFRYSTCTAVVAGLTASLFSSAYAAAPDAGQLVNEQESLRRTTARPEHTNVDIAESASTAAVDQGSKVTVRSFSFSGDTDVVSSQELSAVVRPYVGRELGFVGLQEVAAAVTGHLRRKGYVLARAYLPKQDVTAGAVDIAIIAGRTEGGVSVNAISPMRVRKPLLDRIAASAATAGGVMDVSRIERAVLLMNDLPGVNARASLERGSAPGTTKVTVNAKEGPFMNAAVSADNFGNRFTGSMRRTSQFAVNDLTGFGDRFNAAWVNSDYMNQGRIGYRIPIDAAGDAVDASYSVMKYRLAGAMESLDSKGRADTAGAGFEHPLQRTRDASVWVGARGEWYRLRDEANGNVSSERRIPVAQTYLNGTFLDRFLRGGITNVRAAVSGGSNAIKDETADAGAARSAGHFSKTEYSVSRLQGISPIVAFFLSARGQVADGNLDSSQKFILGGPSGVRAYPVGEGSGDDGHIFTFESRCDLPFTPEYARMQLIGFFDTGYVREHDDTWGSSVSNATGRNHYWLSGFGPGVSVGKDDLYRVQLSYARRIGNNSGRNEDGTDSDKRDAKGRVWLQGVVWF